MTNQWVNSYKRLVPGTEAPMYVTWSPRNHSDLVRVPELKPGSADSSRIEYRVPDAAANPYLAFAAVLAAGLDGIEQGHTLPAPVLSATDQLSLEEIELRGLGVLPESLGEAIERFEASTLMRETLGSHVHDTLVANKKIEWADYRSQVTAFEIDHYLPML
jgi:glutamine synthetase